MPLKLQRLWNSIIMKVRTYYDLKWKNIYILPEVAVTACVCNFIEYLIFKIYNIFLLKIILYSDAPLTADHLLDVLKTVNDWKGFFNYMCVAPRSSVLDTVTVFIEELNVEATWKKVALALYHNNEEKTMDRLFHYMKSPTGKSIFQSIYSLYLC